jgi:uncharacterized protein
MAVHVVGLISDTHGQVRAGVHSALAGVGLILHAGDVGEGVLDELALIAPVRAVTGNTDAPDSRLSPSLVLNIGGVSFHVSHGHEVGSPTPAKLLAKYPEDVIVYGHTHRYLETRDGGRLVINPGAAGPQRFDLKPSVVRLTVRDGAVETDLVTLAADD